LCVSSGPAAAGNINSEEELLQKRNESLIVTIN
jgi:hypothetical protein